MHEETNVWPYVVLVGMVLFIAYLIWSPAMSNDKKVGANISNPSAFDCTDFTTHQQAQSFYEQNGGPQIDTYRLDRNRDGIACETLP